MLSLSRTRLLGDDLAFVHGSDFSCPFAGSCYADTKAAQDYAVWLTSYLNRFSDSVGFTLLPVGSWITQAVLVAFAKVQHSVGPTWLDNPTVDSLFTAAGTLQSVMEQFWADNFTSTPASTPATTASSPSPSAPAQASSPTAVTKATPEQIEKAKVRSGAKASKAWLYWTLGAVGVVVVGGVITIAVVRSRRQRSY